MQRHHTDINNTEDFKKTVAQTMGYSKLYAFSVGGDVSFPLHGIGVNGLCYD